MDIRLKQLWLISLCLFAFLFKQNVALSICPMSNWSMNATTVAGSPTGISGSNASALSNPYDVFVSNSSAIYVLDSGNYRVQLLNAALGTTVIQGSPGTQLNQFGAMSQMSVDTIGNIYILDATNNRVTLWAPGATVGSVVAGGNGQGSNANQINTAYGMYVERGTSTIWIADTGNHRIVKYSSSSTGTIVCGTYGSGATQFSSPTGVFIDENDNNTLYVADTGNQRIQQWISGATSATTIAGQTGNLGSALNQLFYPSRVIVDTNKNMFIVDTGNNRVMLWTVGSSSGQIIAGNSIGGTLPNQLNFPSGISFDSSGSLFIADAHNNRVEKFAVNCLSSTISTSMPRTYPTSTSKATMTVRLSVIGSAYQKLSAIIFVALIMHNI